MTRFELWRRNAWLVLRRAPFDRRALGLLLAWLGLCAFLVYEAGMMIDLGPWGTLSVLLILALATGVAGWMAHANRRAGESLLRLSARTSAVADDLSGHAKVVAEVLLKTAVMVDRAGGEALVRQRKMPPENSGLCRRRTLDLAQRPELWDRFVAAEQQLLIAQEGSWTWEQIWPHVLQAEDVRVLRWVLRMDAVLTPFEFLELDLAPALQVTLKPESIKHSDCLASYDLRPAQSMAQMMVTRCVGEGIRRGILTEPDSAARTHYLALADRMAADESRDLLIGTVTVAKADAEKIQAAAQAAIRRMFVLTALIDYLNGPASANLLLDQPVHEPTTLD